MVLQGNEANSMSSTIGKSLKGHEYTGVPKVSDTVLAAKLSRLLPAQELC